MNLLKKSLKKLAVSLIALALFPLAASAYSVDSGAGYSYETDHVELTNVYSTSSNQYSQKTVNPNKGETLNLNFCINTPAYIKVGIYGLDGDDYHPVNMLKEQIYYSAGCHSVNWDVKYYNSIFGPNYSVVQAGTYYFGVNAQNSVDADDKDYKAQWIYVTHYDNNQNNNNNPNNNSGQQYNYCSNFNDVYYSNPYCNAILWANQNNIFSGYHDGSFRPNQAISRIEALKAVLVATNANVTTTTTYNYMYAQFNDVNFNDWYGPYLNTALYYNIASGFGDGTFRPYYTLSSSEAQYMLAQANQQLYGAQLPNVYYGEPATQMTRAQFAYMLYQYNQNGNNNYNTYWY